MRSSCLVFSLLVLSGSLFAQYRGGPNTSTSLGGFGNVLYPGTGGPPPARTGVSNFPSQLGNTIQGRPYGGSGVYRTPQMVNPGHSRTVVVPYAVPVLVNGGPTDAYLPSPAPQSFQQPAPTVIINQNFAPEMLHPSVREYPETPPMTSGPSAGMRSYEAPTRSGVERVDAPPAARAEDANRPTIYQIAFKSGATYSTVAYWMDGDTLNYVTRNGSVNRASIDLIDVELSEQLNQERNVEFQLPH